MTWLLEVRLHECLYDLRIGFCSECEHFLALGPARPTLINRAAHIARSGLVRIDTSCEQRLELCINGREPECFLDERVEAERWKMPFVEDQRVSQCDGLRVIRPLRQQSEELRGALAVSPVPRDRKSTRLNS